MIITTLPCFPNHIRAYIILIFLVVFFGNFLKKFYGFNIAGRAIIGQNSTFTAIGRFHNMQNGHV